MNRLSWCGRLLQLFVRTQVRTAIILLSYCGIDEGKTLAGRIRDKVEKTAVPYEGDQLNVTLSIGVAASPPCNPDGPALEVYAENGLKQAKRMGKNRVVVSASN